MDGGEGIGKGGLRFGGTMPLPRPAGLIRWAGCAHPTGSVDQTTVAQRPTLHQL